MIYVSVPWLPPSANNAYINKRGGGRLLSADGRKFLTETKAHLARTYPEQMKFFRKDVSYLIAVRFCFEAITNSGWPKTAASRYKRIDLGNRLKLLEDALKDAAGFDDSQNFTLVLLKRQGVGCSEIWAWEMAAEKTPFDDGIQELDHIAG